MWQTLMKILPKEKKSASGVGSVNLSGTKFNRFFTSVARNLCSAFKENTFPNPRDNSDFSLQEVRVSFVRHELSKLKSSKATGLDKIPARLLKDA